MKKFNHSFAENFDIKQIEGYRQALNEVYLYLCEVTQFKPENRFIDCVPLLDRIKNTADELTSIMQKEQDRLKELSETELNLLAQQHLS